MPYVNYGEGDCCEVESQLSFHRFSGLPTGRAPLGLPVIATFAIRSGCILPTWSRHALLRALVHLTISGTWQSSRVTEFRIRSLRVLFVIDRKIFISVVRSILLVTVVSALVSAAYVRIGLIHVL